MRLMPAAAAVPMVLLLALTQPVSAQPDSDIFVGSITFDNGVFQIVDITNVTDHPGYDNQPHFLPDGTALLFTRGMNDGQMDIFRYTLASRRTERLTRTSESEYSPTPLLDGSGFSVIQVEADSTQRLWRFGWTGSDPDVLLPDLAPIGYQAWANDSTVAVFVLGQPPTLQLANTSSGQVTLIAESIGRSLHRIPGQRDISFVHKVGDGDWWITRLDAASGQLVRLTPTLPDREDYAWTPFGTIFMADGAVLYQWTATSDGWDEIADLSATGVGTISRIAVSQAGTHIAFVGTR